jgi:hypothetical protein
MMYYMLYVVYKGMKRATKTSLAEKERNRIPRYLRVNVKSVMVVRSCDMMQSKSVKIVVS